jgi:sulfatase maturation enzyme AslB (radical SAM superfamily)
MNRVKYNKLKIVTLLVTRNCNLECQYCYVREKKGHNMLFTTAKSIINEAFLEIEDSFDFLEINFLGGEPFLAFDTIKQICEWTWSKNWHMPYVFSAVTNGTVYNEEIKTWLVKNKESFRLCISYDGAVEAQDMNRSNSNSQIDLDFFMSNWPSQPVKMTVSEASVSLLATNIIELQRKGILVNCSFAGGVPLWKEETLNILKNQLKLLADYYSMHLELQPSNLFQIDVTPVLQGMTSTTKNRCGIGCTRVTYDSDGRKYLCHLLSPLVLDKKQLSCLEKYDLSNCADADIPTCKECILDNICPTCIGNSFRLFENPYYREKNLCSFFKIQVVYACQYQAKRILNKASVSESDRISLEAIAYILKILKI